MPFEKGLYSMEFLEPGVMKIESTSGIAKFYWKDARKQT